MSARLKLAIPSKGRLMETTRDLFGRAGLTLDRADKRGYRGRIEGRADVEVWFLSASEIAHALRIGRVHLGVTGEDLIRETIPDADRRVALLVPLGFGFADVVVAVPECWIDVARMSDLEEVGALFHRTHGRRLRVATKFMNLTRRFFAENDVSFYRIVESAGATEGTPASGTAELIVDITTSGATLRANHLRVLEDGVILRSQARLVASRQAPWCAETESARTTIVDRLRGVLRPT